MKLKSLVFYDALLELVYCVTVHIPVDTGCKLNVHKTFRSCLRGCSSKAGTNDNDLHLLFRNGLNMNINNSFNTH